MDQLDTENRANQAVAQLGLKLAKADGSAVGAAPDAEDLAALYEGVLDATRRAQVLSHIANDPAVYSAWVEVAAAQAALDQNPAASADSVAHKTSMVQRLAAWLRESFRMPALAGGMVAAGLAVVLLLPGQDSTQLNDIDQIYADFGSSWQAHPSTLHDRIIRSTGATPVATAEQQAIYQGLQEGLVLLGDDVPAGWLPKMTLKEDANALSPEDRNTFQYIGKLATLARFKCQLARDSEPAFFHAAEQSMDKLRQGIHREDSKTGSYLARVIDQPGTADERVCDFAKATVAVLTNK